MYDTISLWLPLSKNDVLTTLSELPLKLMNCQENYNYRTGYTSITGNLNSMYFSIRETGVFLNGSLCKYHFGNNQKTLTLNDTRTAFKCLANTTSLPIFEAAVYRIDFGENFILSEPTNLYYDYLGDSTYYQRLEQNNGLYYNNLRRQLLFYGKIQEQKLKRQTIINDFQNKNVLRYEMRLKRKLSDQVNLPNITPKHLCESSFYKKLVEKYQTEYHSISKKHQLSLENDVITQKHGLINQLLLLGANAMGGESELLKLIDRVKKSKAFSNQMQAKRLKDKIKSIFRTPILSKPSLLIKELDHKIDDKIKSEIASIS